MTDETRDDLVARDARALWHPFTQHAVDVEPLPVKAAQGTTLVLEDGREILDAVSSWWSCLHGHGHPRIVRAMAEQAAELDHVMFAGFTHEPAVQLAERVLALAPPGLKRVFYSDNGSTAVEVALKMVVQSFVQRGEPDRRVFVALEGGYHGDTFGAMAVGDPDPFFVAFQPMLFRVRRVPAQAEALERALDELGDEAAGIIMEPLVQGAGGMLMHGPELVRAARDLTSARGLALIADEVMTGFGRTGTVFACEQAGVTPDAMAIAKGLTGGSLPLSATLATEELYESFLIPDRNKAFFHGHTFTGNPIGCRVGLASLDILEEERTPERLSAIGTRIASRLEDLVNDPRIRELRRTGGIVALELEPPAGESAGYISSLITKLRRESLARGVLLRPLGNVLYALPPSCTTMDECDRIAAVMREVALLP